MAGALLLLLFNVLGASGAGAAGPPGTPGGAFRAIDPGRSFRGRRGA